MGNANGVLVLDPSVGSRNLGDAIISKAVFREIVLNAPEAWIERFSSHQTLGIKVASRAKRLPVTLVGGSNLVDLQMSWLAFRNQWSVGTGSTALLRGAPLSLFGVGMKRGSGSPTRAARTLLPRLLNSQNVMHAARDCFTRDALERIGVANLEFTACPTMWTLTPEHVCKIPTSRARKAVITLTDYSRDPKADKAWLKVVLDNYEELFFWPQGSSDTDYFSSLNLAREVTILRPTLQSYEGLLAKGAIDSVGTRLHAGIHALAHGSRAVILAVDHRARELSRDSGLVVFDRETAVESVEDAIHHLDLKALSLPVEAIARWRSWFANSMSERSW